MLLDLSLIIAFSLLLLKSTGWIIGSLKYFSKLTGLGKFSLTGLVMALSTSLPELSIAVASAVEGNSALVLGNILGANIINLSLMAGAGAVIAGAVHATGRFLKTDAFYAFLSGALPLLLLIDGRLGRLDGLILILVYFIYNAAVFREDPVNRRQVFHRIFSHLTDKTADAKIWWFILGIMGMIIGAGGIVRAASSVAAELNLPILLVGLLLVSLGTTLPELFFEIKSLRAGQSAMALGDLMGSIVANATLILGLSAAIRPIVLQNGSASYLTATIAYALAFAAFYLFIRTKRRLERWEGAALVGLYCIFVLVEIL